MGQDPDGALRQTVATQETALEAAARDCAHHLVLPLTQANRPALEQAVSRLSDAMRLVTVAANRIRFAWGDGPDLAARQRSLADLDARMRTLARVMLVIGQIMSARPRPLYPPDDAPRNLWTEQALAADRVHVALNRVVNPEPQDAAAEGLGCFADIPLPPSRFMAHAHAAYRVALAQRRPQPARFLDVGCGGGIKVLLAAEFFPCADGLEYDAGYAATARRVLDRAGRVPSQVILADALTFDGYGDYDVLYFYQPMKSPEGLIALEQRIARCARPGTILIAPYGMFSDRAESLGCGRVDGAVYLAGTSARDAERIRRKARHIGVEIPRPQDWNHLNDGYLRTLVDACSRVGYEVI